MVINSMGWIEDLGYELLMHSAAALKADVVLVVGSERLYSQVAADLRGKGEAGLGGAGWFTRRGRRLPSRHETLQGCCCVNNIAAGLCGLQ